MDCDQTRISFTDTPEGCMLRLSGALGVADAETLRQAALQVQCLGKSVVVDWSDATQLDASIAQVLLSLQSSVRARGGSISAAAMPPEIRAWMQAAGLCCHLAVGAGGEGGL